VSDDSSRERVVDFLCKISSEGVEYYFTDYASPETAERLALEAGVERPLALQLRNAAESMQRARKNVDAALAEIRSAFGIEEGEVEM